MADIRADGVRPGGEESWRRLPVLRQDPGPVVDAHAVEGKVMAGAVSMT
ncbi:hypothetical protein [Streptomyces sp. NBRC 110028]|nr:hypothetical protein [Streptomyces sp. NBRC 110028]